MARPVRQIIAIALLASLAMAALWAVPAAASNSSDLVSKVNSARRSAGKSKVQVYSDLTDDAKSHARRMRDQQKISTLSNLGKVTSDWKALGQVVGAGPNVSALFDAFMSSGGHRATILG